jgi:hypothetical protein
MQLSELADLPLTDRLQAMETLWDSLCRDPNFDPSPAWHAEVLAERRAELEQGRHVPWDEAKARLQAMTRKDS